MRQSQITASGEKENVPNEPSKSSEGLEMNAVHKEVLCSWDYLNIIKESQHDYADTHLQSNPPPKVWLIAAAPAVHIIQVTPKLHPIGQYPATEAEDTSQKTYNSTCAATLVKTLVAE